MAATKGQPDPTPTARRWRWPAASASEAVTAGSAELRAVIDAHRITRAGRERTDRTRTAWWANEGHGAHRPGGDRHGVLVLQRGARPRPARDAAQRAPLLRDARRPSCRPARRYRQRRRAPPRRSGTLLAFGGRRWDAATTSAKDAAGMGCFSLTGRWSTIESARPMAAADASASSRRASAAGAVARLHEEKRGVTVRRVDDDGGHPGCGTSAGRVVSGAMAAPTARRARD